MDTNNDIKTIHLDPALTICINLEDIEKYCANISPVETESPVATPPVATPPVKPILFEKKGKLAYWCGQYTCGCIYDDMDVFIDTIKNDADANKVLDALKNLPTNNANMFDAFVHYLKKDRPYALINDFEEIYDVIKYDSNCQNEWHCVMRLYFGVVW